MPGSFTMAGRRTTGVAAARTCWIDNPPAPPHRVVGQTWRTPVMNYRRWIILLGPAVLGAALALAACQPQSGGDLRVEPPSDLLYGDGTADREPVVAQVGGIGLTTRDLAMKREELSGAEARPFEGPFGDRLLLKHMVDEALMVLDAYDRELYEDPSVVRTLAVRRRVTMIDAMRNIALLKDKEPSEEELREYFLANRENYMLQGTMHARHIEAATEADARAAYDHIMETEPSRRNRAFLEGIRDYSVNVETKQREGNLGWFNKGGYVGAVNDPKAFTRMVWDFEKGVHPPIQVGDRWHVVEVFSRQYDRPMTYEEARDRVRAELLPQWQQQLVREYLLDARQRIGVEYFGEFRPGQGKTPEQLYERAFLVQDPAEKMALYRLLLDDYPESDLVDEALFLAANLLLDTWNDQLEARRYIRELIERFPEAETVEDARYILENMGRPGFRNPKTIQDLQR